MKKIHENAVVFGLFERIHAGHERIFNYSKEIASYLTIVVDDRYVEQSELAERLATLRSCGHYVTSWSRLISNPDEYRFDVCVAGDATNVPQLRDLLDRIGFIDAPIIIFPGVRLFSSISYENPAQEVGELVKIDEVLRVFRNLDLGPANLESLRQSLAKLPMLVLGDFILDRYIFCDPVGMSGEDPCLVVSEKDVVDYFGGAAAVASYVNMFTTCMTFATVIGGNSERLLEDLRDRYGRASIFLKDENRVTATKIRYRVAGRNHLRVDQISTHALVERTRDLLWNQVVRCISEHTTLILSDFNYGVLDSEMSEKILKYAKENGCLTLADSQTSSQRGNIQKFNGVDIMSSTEVEVRSSLNSFDTNLDQLINMFFANFNTPKLILKLGADGLLACQLLNDGGVLKTPMRSFVRRVEDASGAGDSILALVGLMSASGVEFFEAVCYANVCAALHCTLPGNCPVDPHYYFSVLERLINEYANN